MDSISRPNPDYIQELIRILNISPYPRHMRMRLAAIDLDTSCVYLDLSGCHLQPFGIVHGGVIATLIDTATFCAVFMRIPDDAGLVNIDLRLNYLKSVVEGCLKAEGRAIKCGRTISYAEASVTDANGALVAHGTSTLMALPEKGIASKTPKFI